MQHRAASFTIEVVSKSSKTFRPGIFRLGAGFLLTASIVTFARWPLVRGGEVYAAHQAGGAQLKRVLDSIERRYHDTQSFSASCTEIIEAVGGKKRERTGTMYLQKPGKMRWNFKLPDTETIVSDGTTLYNYDPDLDQVVETPLRQALASSSAAAFLLGVGSIEEEFDASMPPGASPAGVTRILLVPKGAGNQIDLSVDSQTFDIVALTLKDQLGNRTAISFSDIKHNAPMSDALFAFKVPSGADIVTAPPPQ